jgi:hypothetical protein
MKLEFEKKLEISNSITPGTFDNNACASLRVNAADGDTTRTVGALLLPGSGTTPPTAIENDPVNEPEPPFSQQAESFIEYRSRSIPS